MAKNTSPDEENVDTIENKIQDTLPGVKIVTVNCTSESEHKKSCKNRTNKKSKKKNKKNTSTQKCLPDTGEQTISNERTIDNSSVIVESTSQGQQEMVNKTSQELVTSQDKDFVPEKNSPKEISDDPQISGPEVKEMGQGKRSVDKVVCGIDRTFTILKTGTASMLHIPVVCNRRPMTAVIDSAAEVTILSDKIYNSLQDQPKILRKTVMYAAGRGMQMDTIIVGPVKLEVGSKSYCIEVYVAPIDDEMLLGLDFLKRHQTITDLKNNTFTIGGDQIPLYCGPQRETPVVAKVTVPKRTVVPPHSVVRMPGQVDVDLPSFIVESSPQYPGPLLVPTCFFQDSKPTLCVFNPTGSSYTLRKNAVIAQASGAHELRLDNPIIVQEVTLPDSESDNFDEKIDKMVSRAEDNLTSSQLSRLRELLKQNANVFSINDLDIGEFQEVEHSIDTGSAEPIRQRLRRTPISFAGEEEKLLGKMLDAKLIEPSVSAWASPPVLIRKRDGTVRYAIDYRKLNAVTKKEVYPLPIIEECIDSLAGNKWFSKLDANSAYYQVKMKEEDKQKTAFITKYGLFQFTRMSFGLCNAPSTYSRAMQLVLRGLTWDIVLAFLDDILVMGKDFDSHLDNLTKVFERFRQYGIKLKPVKCEFCTKETTFLGRRVNGDGLAIGEEYVQTIKEWRAPSNLKEIEQFLGFVNYHRTFIKDFSKIAAPLTELTRKKPWKWGEEQQTAYERLKSALQTTPVLAIPDKTGTFILDTDASDKAIGAELIQIQNGQERVVAYGSFTLSPAQRRYCTTRKELLAVVRFTQHFKHYLLGREFILRTDHNSLRWLMNFKDLQGQLARWLEVLSQYIMKIQHRSGNKHVNADILSRYQPGTPCHEMSIYTDPKDLPCQGCAHCTKIHRSWSTFATEIDDTVPLGTAAVKKCSVVKPLDRNHRDSCVRQLEKIQRKTDEIYEDVTELQQEWTKLRKMLNSWKSKSKLKNKLLIKCVKDSEKLYNLAQKLQDLSIPELEIDLIKFQAMTQIQLGLLAKNCNELKASIKDKKHKAKGIKPRLEPIVEQNELEEICCQSKRRFDPNRPQILDAEALQALFGFSTESGVEAEKDTGDWEQFIEIAEGKDVRVVTMRQKNIEQNQKVARDDTSELQMTKEVNSELTEKGDESNVLPHYTTIELRDAQKADDNLTLILYFLENNAEPAQSEVAINSPAAKAYLLNREFFYLNDNGILYNVSKYGVHRLVVPQKYREEIMSLNHDLVCTGHQGVQRTRERIKARFYWYRMHSDVRDFVKSCKKCNLNKKASRKAKAPMTKYHAGAPMERVHLDFLGPLPETPRGNTNILVMVDQFTKWCEIVPLPSQTAETTARAAVNEFFARFGCPFSVHTDQGRNFESRLFKAICDLFHIHKTRTTPYRPSANGQVERYNRTLMDAVRCFVADSQRDWDEYLPQLACAIRSSVNRHTGMTPNKMMLGREINLPAELIFQPDRKELFENEEQYVTSLRKNIQKIHEIARQKLMTTQETMKRDYDSNLREVEYQTGDFVYVLDTAHLKGRTKKLDPPWKGPGIVVERLSPYIYRVRFEKVVVVTNHDRMKKCNDRILPSWLSVAKQKFREGNSLKDVSKENTPYCICRQPDDGLLMIQCDNCRDWMHGQCVNITSQLAETIDKYQCPRCQTPWLYPSQI